jgi:hypothetical protein
MDNYSFVTGATLVVLFVVMPFDIYNGSFLDFKITILPEERILLPGWDLNIAGNVHRARPGFIAYRAGDNAVHLDLLAFYFHDGWSEILNRPFIRKEREIVYERNSFRWAFSFTGRQDQGDPCDQWNHNSTFHQVLRWYPVNSQLNKRPDRFWRLCLIHQGFTKGRDKGYNYDSQPERTCDKEVGGSHAGTMIGTIPVMVCKMLSRFADEGLVKVSRTQFELLNRSDLEKMAGK